MEHDDEVRASPQKNPRSVAARIVSDYHGITIGGEGYEMSTDQLMIRIERALIAAINGELHLEPQFSKQNTKPMEG